MKQSACENLSAIRAIDAHAYGAKAAMLGELLANGLKVPDGLVLPAVNLDSFLRRNQFPYGPDDYPTYSLEIRESIRHYTLDPALEDAIGQCLETLRSRYPQDRVIVRTSALCEDTQTASMAGLFESFPERITLEEVCDAVRGCYASLFSDGALDRYAAGQISPNELRAAVIIQRHISGDVSGVTFTADTSAMDPGKIIISAVRGACSGITSGSEKATTFSCEKERSAVIKVSDDRDLLSDNQISGLLASAIDIERIAGSYQDIEWTIRDGELYILQARPIAGFREKGDPSIWEDGDGSGTWSLRSDACLPPLIGELVVEAENQAGECAYSYGMHWDSVEQMVRNGYVYHRSRPIPNAGERFEAFSKRISSQFDQGEDEFDKYIRPELAGLIDDMHARYINRDVETNELLSYLVDAEFFMKRSSRLHWRATSAEWYMGHFFRERVGRFYDTISDQDLVDMVYSKSLMTAEREKIYEMVAVVQKDPDLHELFTGINYDRIIDARLGRMQSSAVQHLLDLMAEYGRSYGWLHTGSLEEGRLFKPGMVPRVECVNRIKRYLHISIDDYNENLRQVAENAGRLRETGLHGCKTDEERAALETAIEAGEKAFLAGDNHAFYICSRKYSYVWDALHRIADVFAERDMIDSPEDIQFLLMSEVKSSFTKTDSLREIVAKRKAQHAAWPGLLPPDHIGAEQTTGPEERAAGDQKTDQPQTIKGESGTRKNARGRIQIGFPKTVPEDDIILVLDHGHEGDLTTILGCVKGIVMRMGSPACHMGIIARELGIPAIYGVGQGADLLKPGEEVEIRGAAGEVVLPV